MPLLRKFHSVLFVKPLADSTSLADVVVRHNVRRIHPGDIDVDELRAHGVEVCYFRKNAVCYLAFSGDEIVGSGWMFSESRLLARLKIEKGAYMGGFFVQPEYRGKGVYTDLLRVMCAECYPEYRVAVAETIESNSSSIRGLERTGFARAGVLDVVQLLGRLNIRCALSLDSKTTL